MKAQILKIAGVKTEKEFYKKFPSEEAFMKKHGKQLEKAANGFNQKFTAPTMTYKPLDMSLTGAMTNNPYMTGKSSLDTSVASNTTGNSKVDIGGFLTNNLPSIVGAISDIGQTKTDINNLNAYGEISNAVAKAASTRPEKRQRKIDYNAMRSQSVNPLGVGTNYLAAEDGAEIQNTFAPNDIYTDMGYEPLNDSSKVKQFANGGGFNFNAFSGIAGSIGGSLGSATGKGTGRGGAASSIGSSLGSIAGNALLPGVGGPLGSLAGGYIGGLIDSDQQNQEQMAINKLEGQTNAATFQSGVQGILGQNSAVAEDGALLNNNSQPQVIAMFGNHKLSALLQPPNDADMLRAGGSVGSGYYTPPTERAMYTGRAEYGSQMAFGGDVQVGKGYMKPLSNNVSKLIGPSHDRGGMPMSNGDNIIEAEGNETVMKMYDDGGSADDGAVTIFGNRYINQDAADFVGIKSGKKYKTQSEELALNQTKFDKKATKNFASANDMEVNDMFSQIEQRTKLLNGQAFTAKSDEAKQKLKDLAVYQNETGDVAKSFGLDINAFDKGIAKPIKEADMAKFGAKLTKAVDGKKVKYDPEFSNFINQAMMLEQANSYDALKQPNGTFLGGVYRGGADNYGTGTFSDYDTPEKAKEFYYKEYWSKVKDLPAGLRTRALQMAINTGDPYGELMVAAGKMGLDERRNTLNERKDKTITGNKTWEKNKADILKAYKEDPQAFLGKLDAEQDRYYDSYIANNPSSVNNDTRKEFFDDYTGLARFASQDYIPKPENAPMATTNSPVISTTSSPSSLGDISKAERKKIAIANGIKNYTGTKSQNMKLISILNQANDNPIMNPVANRLTGVVDDSGYIPSNEQINMGQELDPSAYAPINMSNMPYGQSTMAPPAGTSVENFGAKSDPRNQQEKGNTDLLNTGLSVLNSLAPFTKPTSQRPLNPDQLLPANLALAMNQLEPVQAQLYNPMLQAQPYRVSLQDQRNDVIAQQRGASRMAVGNPALQAYIAGETSNALTKIGAEENRINQAETMRAAESNRMQSNEAQRFNLGILDQQYVRQSQANSITKQEALGVAKDIALKQAEQRKTNNRQAILENMYPGFSYTKNGVAYKNPMYTAMFNVPDVGTGADSKQDITSPTSLLFGKEETTKSKTTKRNGGIVKAIKNL